MAKGVTPKDIWDELRDQGATVTQAAGIMGNMISESSLNPEATSGNQYGLAQWDTSSYPSAAGLVTGNPQKDMKAQIVFLAQTGGFAAADGASPTAAGQNFAQNYEKCKECGANGAQTNLRGIQAATVAGWASSGDFPSEASQATTTAQITSAESAETQSECLWQISWGGVLGIGSVNFCVLSKTQARALIGAAFLAWGVAITGFGLVLVAAYGFKEVTGKSPAGIGGKALEAGGAIATVAGFPEIGAPVAAAGGGLSSLASQRQSSRQAKQREQKAVEAHEGRQFDQVMARTRDSRKGAAPRELEPAPF